MPISISAKTAGLGSVTDNGDGTWKWKYTPADDATGTVTVTASDDDDEHSVTDWFSWLASNVAPTIDSIVAGSAASCGAQSLITINFHDPAGANDTYAASINWGDGTIDAANGIHSGDQAAHTYAAAGPHTVTVTVSDEDGGTSPAATASAVVSFTIVGGKILQPVNDTRNGQVLPSVFKYGSTIPVKVEITNCNGAHPSSLDVRVLWSKTAGAVPASGDLEATSTNAPDAGNAMRFSDPTYIFNLDQSDDERCDGDLHADRQDPIHRSGRERDHRSEEVVKRGPPGWWSLRMLDTVLSCSLPPGRQIWIRRP